VYQELGLDERQKESITEFLSTAAETRGRRSNTALRDVATGLREGIDSVLTPEQKVGLEKIQAQRAERGYAHPRGPGGHRGVARDLFDRGPDDEPRKPPSWSMPGRSGRLCAPLLRGACARSAQRLREERNEKLKTILGAEKLYPVLGDPRAAVSRLGAARG
jgi:hypothetical protein